MIEGGKEGRNHAIQLLRFLAASVVALVHQAFAYADHLGDGFGFDPPPREITQTAVALFFVVSGYVMVISSRHLFGAVQARRIFWTRRCVRILPPYWLATFLMAGLYLLLGPDFRLADLARSLALIPYREADAAWALPLLWVGWTLFYELVFYALFGLGLARGRGAALAIASAGLVALVLAGAIMQPQGAVLDTLTRPVLLIFIPGMALALWRERGGVLPVWLRLVALALVPVSLALTTSPTDLALLGMDYLLAAGTPAVLLALALLGGPIALPAPRLIDQLGNMSYALYLLHTPIALFWMWAYQKAFHPSEPWLLFVTLAAATYIASWIAFAWIERPMTRWLNHRLLPAKG